MDDAAEVVRREPFGENPLVGERGATTKRRILAAGLRVFAEHGYHGTRVELITEVVGCSRPAFYQYFSSKEDLFWHLAGRLANEMGSLAESVGAIPADVGGVDQLRSWLDAFIDLCTEYDPILTGYQIAARERRPDTRDTRVIGNRVGVAIVHGAGGGHPELALPALTNTLTGVVIRSIYYWRLGLGQVDRDRFLDGLARTVHRVLHGAVPDVNVVPLIGAPARQAPRWPEFPGAREHDPNLRPRGRRTRQTLLDAGSRVLPERGYHATRVDDIVETAGVSHGSFYRYFGNKEELFHVLAEDAAVAMVDLVNSFPDVAEPAAVRDWLERWFATYRANGGVISAWQEIDYDDPELAAFSLEVALVTFDRLVRLTHARGFGDITVDALVLLAVIERSPYAVLTLRHLGEDEALDAATFLVRRGLFGADVP